MGGVRECAWGERTQQRPLLLAPAEVPRAKRAIPTLSSAQCARASASSERDTAITRAARICRGFRREARNRTDSSLAEGRPSSLSLRARQDSNLRHPVP